MCPAERDSPDFWCWSRKSAHNYPRAHSFFKCWSEKPHPHSQHCTTTTAQPPPTSQCTSMAHCTNTAPRNHHRTTTTAQPQPHTRHKHSTTTPPPRRFSSQGRHLGKVSALWLHNTTPRTASIPPILVPHHHFSSDPPHTPPFTSSPRQ